MAGEFGGEVEAAEFVVVLDPQFPRGGGEAVSVDEGVVDDVDGLDHGGLLREGLGTRGKVEGREEETGKVLDDHVLLFSLLDGPFKDGRGLGELVTERRRVDLEFSRERRNVLEETRGKEGEGNGVLAKVLFE